MVVYGLFHQRLFVFRSVYLLAHTLNALFYERAGGFVIQKFVVKQNFARFIAAYLLNNAGFGVLFVFAAGAFKFAGGNVAKTDSEGIRIHIKTANIVVGTFFKHRIFHNRARSYNAHNVALDKSFRCCRVLHLLADCDLVALLYQARDIGFVAVVRNSAHRRAFLLPAFLACQGKLKLLRRGFRVIIEHLVKIAETEEKYSVLIPAFYIKILLHHRRKLRHKNTSARIYIFYFIIIREIVQEKIWGTQPRTPYFSAQIILFFR